jgi:hypothetical protein
MRTGTDPSGHQLSKQMPWGSIGQLDDEELTALYEYPARFSVHRTKLTIPGAPILDSIDTSAPSAHVLFLEGNPIHGPSAG